MKISELPQEVKIKALEYQKITDDKYWDKNTDCLELAFDWENTNERMYYWSELNRLSASEIKIYSEEEVLTILYKHTEDLLAGKKLTLEEWFEEIKKNNL